jgi:DNA repair exonuclease SbcCD nuclease subunit
VRLVHLADLHLGFRQFQRMTPTGINQREADVAAAFRRAIDRIIEIRPDVVLIAGDIFHAVRPPNPAILHSFNNLARLVQEVPGTDVVMIAGNHDTPRASETGCILRLFRQLRIHVVEGEMARVHIREKDLSVLAVPNLPGRRISFAPEPHFRHNILMLHGELRGLIPRGPSPDDRPALEVDPADLHASSWSYVALGHYHVYRQVEPNAFYCGATEYTSTNPWGELAEEATFRIPGKGFIEFDTDTGEHTFHTIPGVRPFVDLPPLSARGLTSLELDDLIADRIAACPGGIDDKVVRLVLRDVPRHVARELDHAAIRMIRRRALHFVLDARRPQVVRSSSAGAPTPRRSLEDTVRDKLSAFDTDVDRLSLTQMALKYLNEAEALSLAAPESDS